MAISNVDICNRSLILVGSQSTVTTMTQDSVESKLLNAIYTSIVEWCLGLANWNFARRTAVLTVSKTVTVPPPNPWTTTQPAPPWKKEFTLPTDLIRALYLTNSDANTTNDAYAGLIRRMAITCNVAGAEVLTTNETSAILVYTTNAVIEDNWPWYFERLVVTTLAMNIAPALKPTMLEFLYNQFKIMFQIAEQTNRQEGLIIDDTTPEWIQALGIPYPMRRNLDPRIAPMNPMKAPPSDNNR